MKPRAAISWSGGKDSLAAFDRARAACDIVASVTMVDEHAARSRSHGLRLDVLAAQASRLGVDPLFGRCSWATYDLVFSRSLDALAARGITHVIFGDILFEEHRDWAERMCRRSGLTAVEPLWGLSTDTLFAEWVDSGADALIVTARSGVLDESWLGRRLDRTMLADFARLGVDPCGERGEYHTVVTNCRFFQTPLAVQPGITVRRADCWALDLLLAAPPALFPSDARATC
jgi:uncharacterized protein (TIGR00290 family)